MKTPDNNSFRNAEGPFPAKLASAWLNLSTYIALYNYGYRNVYELAPLSSTRRTPGWNSRAARPLSARRALPLQWGR